MYSKLQDGSFIVCGFVARDAELKTVGEKRSSLCRWSVKAGEKGNGEDKEAIWVNCQAWHDNARYAASVKKGDKVLCIGKIEKNTGTDGKEYKNLVCEFILIMEGTPKARNVSSGISSHPASVDISDFEEILCDGEVPF